MTNIKRLRAMRLFPLVLLIAACGGSDDPSDAAGSSSVQATGDASGKLASDASTADAMSVDVAAGGVQPMVDPATAAAEAQQATEAEAAKADAAPKADAAAPNPGQ